MTLQAYLDLKNLSYADFGKLCIPEIPRITIRQYALEQRFPRTSKQFQIIQIATGGLVTANDFVPPALLGALSEAG